MKVFTKDSVYVHEKDIAFLMSIGYQVPLSVYEHITGKKIVVGNNRNGYDMYFFCEPEEIDFFKGLDFIVDYYDVKDYTVSEINGLMNKELRKMDEVNNNKKDKPYNELFNDSDLIAHKCSSLLKDAIWAIKGLITIDIGSGTIVSGKDSNVPSKALTMHPNDKGEENDSI